MVRRTTLNRCDGLRYRYKAKSSVDGVAWTTRSADYAEAHPGVLSNHYQM